MYRRSISPLKQKAVNSLVTVLGLTIFIIMLPFLFIASIGLSLITLLVIKMKKPRVDNQNKHNVIIQAVKNKDYTVS